MNLASFHPAVSAFNVFLQSYADKIKKDSNGRINIRIFPQASLLPGADTWLGTARGVADFGCSFRFENVGTDIVQYLNPFLLGANTSTIGQLIQYDLLGKFPEFAKEWTANKVIALATTGPAHLTTKAKAVITVADWKGLQIRGSGASDSDMIKAFGASPAAMTMDEVYQALQKGMVDGFIAPIEVLQSYRTADVTKYTTIGGIRLAAGLFLAMNWDSYNGLPADLKKVIDDDIPWAKDEFQKMCGSIDLPAVQFAKEKGHVFNVLTADQLQTWVDTLKPVHQKWVDGINAKGLPGTAIYDFVRAEIVKYNQVYPMPNYLK